MPVIDVRSEFQFPTVLTPPVGFAPPQIAIVRFSGRIDARGRDNQLILRINGSASNYKSYVDAGGDYRAGEWGGPTGLYIGRNGWSLDADICFECRIGVSPGRNRCAFGQATFMHGNQSIIGYASHGSWGDTNTPVNSLELFAIGGGQLVGDFTWSV